MKVTVVAHHSFYDEAANEMKVTVVAHEAFYDAFYDEAANEMKATVVAHEVKKEPERTEPTPQEVRDYISDRLRPNDAKTKKVGDHELIIFHNSGKKFKVDVSELDN